MEKVLMEAEKILEVQGNEIHVCVIPEGKFFERGFFGEKRKIGYDRVAIEQMVANWQNKVLHYDPILNVSHNDDLCGEVQELSAIFDSEKQNGLWAKIVLDETGQNLLDKKKYRYLSPEIYHHFVDADGNDRGYVFAGVALTNYPRHKKIKKLMFSEVAEKLMEWFNATEDDDEIEVETMANDNAVLQELETMKQQIARFKEQEHQLRVDKWIAETRSEGYTAATMERFAQLLKEQKIDFELAEELIKMTQKVSTEQVVASFSEEKHEIDLEEMGIEANKKFAKTEVNEDA